MKHMDEWDTFADLLGNLIAKYADVLDMNQNSDNALKRTEKIKDGHADGTEIENDKAA